MNLIKTSDDYARVCVNGIILNEKNEIMLVKRALEPEQGTWAVMGTIAKPIDDNLEASLIRRTKEVTGLDIELTHLVGVISSLEKKPLADTRFSVAQVLYVAKVKSGEQKLSRAISDFIWIESDRIGTEKLAFNHNELIKLYLEKKDNLIPIERRKYTENFGLDFPYERSDFYHIAAKALVLNDKNEILLAHRYQRPYKDHWDLPGGHMYFDETVEECLKRELREELNVGSKIEKLFHVYSDKGANPKFARALIAYLVKIESEDFQKNIEMDDFGYFSLDNLPEKIAYHYETVLEDLRDYLKYSNNKSVN